MADKILDTIAKRLAEIFCIFSEDDGENYPKYIKQIKAELHVLAKATRQRCAKACEKTGGPKEIRKNASSYIVGYIDGCHDCAEACEEVGGE